MNATLPPTLPTELRPPVRGRAFRLERGRAFRLEGSRRGSALRCLAGRVWITQAGDPGDYVLSAGQQLRLRAAGRIVLEALTPRAEMRQELAGHS